MPRETEREWFRRFWRSLRDACLRKPRVHAKSRSKHERPTQTRWKHLGNIDEFREIATFQYGRGLWLHRCRQHCTWTWVTKSIWKYSRLLNLRTFKVCSVLRVLKEQAIKWTKARVLYVYLDSVLCLGKMHGPEDPIKKSGMIKCQLWRCVKPSENCKGWMECRLTSSGRFSQEPQRWTHSPRNSGKPARKVRHTWKIQWSDNLHVNVERHCSGKERKWRFLCSNVKEYQIVWLKIKEWTQGVLGTLRRIQVVSRIWNQSRWQMGSLCFTNGGRFREFRTPSIERG